MKEKLILKMLDDIQQTISLAWVHFESKGEKEWAEVMTSTSAQLDLMIDLLETGKCDWV